MPSNTTARRPQDFRTTLAQIGGRTFLAVSGGRWTHDDSDLLLPVSNGYRVRVALMADDTYTVSREFVRSGRVWVKATESGVYCDQLSESVWRLHCFR